VGDPSAGLPRTLRRLIAAQLHNSIRSPEEPELEQYVDAEGNKVTARQVRQDSITVISVWCHASVVSEQDALMPEVTFQALNVPTDSGPMRASDGDFVVRHSDGSFEVRKAYEFRSNFREV
jgi:hypothetical protein